MRSYMNRRRILLAAVLAFGLCQLLPALTLAGDRMQGWQATYLSFVGAAQIPSAAGQTSPARGQLSACACGAVANTLFVVSIGWLAWRQQRLAVWISRGTVLFAIASVLFLWTGSEQFMPNVGCLVWLIALAIPLLTTKSSALPVESANVARTTHGQATLPADLHDISAGRTRE